MQTIFQGTAKNLSRWLTDRRAMRSAGEQIRMSATGTIAQCKAEFAKIERNIRTFIGAIKQDYQITSSHCSAVNATVSYLVIFAL
jgi:hypothetical protein